MLLRSGRDSLGDDDSPGDAFESTKVYSTTNLLRRWRRYSRLQRSLLTAVPVVLLFLVVIRFNDYSLQGGDGRHQQLVVDQRIRGQIAGPGFQDNSFDYQQQGRANRVKAVHDALLKNEPDVIHKESDIKEGLEKAVDANEDKADEVLDDEDPADGAPDEEVKGGPGGHGGRDEGAPPDSNLAVESFNEVEDGGGGGGAAPERSGKVPAAAAASLPPKDGSLTFSGPTNQRQRAVVDAFKHGWSNYRKFAWGHDHLRPISRSAQNWFGLGLTLVDSLDTMLVMGLKSDFEEARDWVSSSLDFDRNVDVNLFETTIRVVGGLLSAFHLSADPVFLDKAKDLGQRMMGSFASPSGIPYSDVNLLSAKGHSPKWSMFSSTSEVTTIQLEFRDLSRCTGNDQFEKAATKVSEVVNKLEKLSGLVPIYISPNTGKFQKSSAITLGARGDSYYEYLLKQWIQTGHTIDYMKDDFLQSVSGMANLLAKRTSPNNLLFLGELLSDGQSFKPKMDELACFLPGTLALAHLHGLSLSGTLPKGSTATKGGGPDGTVGTSHLLLELAEELAYTCYLTFARQPTFLAPEITYFNVFRTDEKVQGGLKEPAGQESTQPRPDFIVKPNDSHYLLRPETIESLWYLYYVTGNKTYQDWGWNIFQGIEKYTKVGNGYTTIGNVKNPLDLRPKDMMESYFLGETLKYLYLLFADKQEIDLKRWVINTEAHFLPIRPN